MLLKTNVFYLESINKKLKALSNSGRMHADINYPHIYYYNTDDWPGKVFKKSRYAAFLHDPYI